MAQEKRVTDEDVKDAMLLNRLEGETEYRNGIIAGATREQKAAGHRYVREIINNPEPLEDKRADGGMLMSAKPKAPKKKKQGAYRETGIPMRGGGMAYRQRMYNYGGRVAKYKG